MSAATSTKQLESFVRSVVKSYGPDEAYEAMTPIEEFIFSFLLWNTTTTKANVAQRKFSSDFVDFNELRVTQSEDIADLLGVQYPQREERVQRLLAALNDVYNREHAVALDSLKEMSKRDGRQYLNSISGMTPYVAARVTLVVLGGHATPVDDRMLEAMVEEDLFEDGTTCAEAIGALERVVRASDGLETYQALQAWADDGMPRMSKAASSGSKQSPRNNTKRKTSRSS